MPIMPLEIRPAEPDRLPGFAGVVEGIDLSRPIGPEEVAAIAAGMDKFAVLVFHDQQIDDEQQLAFSRHFGPLEQAASHGIARQLQRGLAPEIADISNLGRANEILARDDRVRLFGLGNMLWHSDSSFKPTPVQIFAAARPYHPAERRQH
jgi:alpha-ketoglutarate-dependent 2,4-dichlorophenoxyacetate dioxygenase